MSTKRGDGPTIPAGVNPKSAGTVRDGSGDIPSGLGPTPSGSARGGGTVITSGMHGLSPVSTTISHNPGDPLIINSVTYQYQGIISKDTGEADIFLLSKDGNKYVFKLYKPNIKPKEDVVQQLMQLKHEDIVNVLGYGWYNHDRFFEIMEYAEGGALDKYLPIKDIARLKSIVSETINAFKFCHANGIVHKDIKPENLYFKHADGRDILLGDFGISTVLDTHKSRHLTSQSLTVGYAAPEMYGIRDQNDGKIKVFIGKEVDYYALGITLIHIWDGKSPFDSMGIHEISNLTTCGMVLIPDDMPREVQKLVKGLITVDYTQRWGYDEIRRWLKGEDVPVHFQIKEQTYPPYQFSPTEAATTTEELADILMENRDKGRKHLYSGKLSAWINLFNQGLAVELDRIVEDDYPMDQEVGLQKAIFVLNPDEPYVHLAGQVRKECTTTAELADVLEGGFSQYLNQLSNPEHQFYLYLEAHEADREANAFRKFYKNFSPKKALNTIILELRGRESFKFGDEMFFFPEDLLKYKDQQFLVNELKDVESGVSLWIAGSENNEIKERVEKWRKIDWDELPISYALSQKISPSLSDTLKGLSDPYTVVLRQWANEALKGDATAHARLTTIYKEKHLILASEILDDSVFTTIKQNWQAALDDYERIRNLIRGKHDIATADDGLVRAQLLLTSLPDNDDDIAYLRQRTQQAVNTDARKCSWFRNIGDPATADPAMLILIHALADDAAEETKALRANKLAEYKEGVGHLFKVLLIAIGGGIVGFFLGVLLGWLPANVITFFADGLNDPNWSELVTSRTIWIRFIASIICAFIAVGINSENYDGSFSVPKSFSNGTQVLLGITLVVTLFLPLSFFSNALETKQEAMQAAEKTARERIIAVLNSGKLYYGKEGPAENVFTPMTDIGKYLMGEELREYEFKISFESFDPATGKVKGVMNYYAENDRAILAVEGYLKGSILKFWHTATIRKGSSTADWSYELVVSGKVLTGSYARKSSSRKKGVVTIWLTGDGSNLKQLVSKIRPVGETEDRDQLNTPSHSSATERNSSISKGESQILEGVPVVINSATLKIEGQIINLWGVRGAAGQFVKNMSKFIKEQGGGVSCKRTVESMYICKTATGVDVASAALINGAATISEDAPSKYRR